MVTVLGPSRSSISIRVLKLYTPPSPVQCSPKCVFILSMPRLPATSSSILCTAWAPRIFRKFWGQTRRNCVHAEYYYTPAGGHLGVGQSVTVPGLAYRTCSALRSFGASAVDSNGVITFSSFKIPQPRLQLNKIAEETWTNEQVIGVHRDCRCNLVLLLLSWGKSYDRGSFCFYWCWQYYYKIVHRSCGLVAASYLFFSYPSCDQRERRRNLQLWAIAMLTLRVDHTGHESRCIE